MSGRTYVLLRSNFIVTPIAWTLLPGAKVLTNTVMRTYPKPYDRLRIISPVLEIFPHALLSCLSPDDGAMASFGRISNRLHLSCGSNCGRNSDAANILRTLILSKDKPNRILIYPGAFNPPHASHISVLRHALESSPDLNIVAAMVRIKRENYLERKNKRSGRTIVLTNEQRANLWRKDSRLPANAWVCGSPRSTAELQESLIKVAKMGGFDITFMLLVGSDNWEVNAPPSRYNWLANEFLISDAGRPATWCSDGGRPLQAKGCTAWERVNLDAARIEKGANQAKKPIAKWSMHYARAVPTPSFVDTGNAGSAPLDGRTKGQGRPSLQIHEDVIWECCLKSDPKIKARFVSKRHYPKIESCSACRNGFETSSTAISCIIEGSPRPEGTTRLKSLVLSHDLLLEYLVAIEARRRGRCTKSASPFRGGATFMSELASDRAVRLFWRRLRHDRLARMT